MLLGFTSPTLTPPEVTMASATGRGPVMDSLKCFSSCSSARRCSFFSELAFSSGESPSRRHITGTMLWAAAR